MDAQAEGFGDLDQDHEKDFASFLRPKTPGAAPAPAAKTSAAKKSAPKGKNTSQEPQEAPVASDSSPGDPEGEEATERTTAGSSGRPRRGRPPGVGTGASAKLVLWTPISIRSRMQRVRTETGKKYADQILDALEATIDDLPDLIAAAVEAKQVHGRLFDRRVEVETSEEIRKQLTIPGVTASHLAVIDDLVESTGAGSRSKLVNVALDQALPPAPEVVARGPEMSGVDDAVF